MGILQFLGVSGAPRRLIAYAVDHGPNGTEQVSPIGTVPAPSKACENRIRRTYQPQQDDYIYDEIDQYPVVVRWCESTIDALCFESGEVAMMYPGFERLTRTELAGPFDHFSQWAAQGVPFFDEACDDDAFADEELMAS